MFRYPPLAAGIAGCGALRRHFIGSLTPKRSMRTWIALRTATNLISNASLQGG